MLKSCVKKEKLQVRSTDAGHTAGVKGPLSGGLTEDVREQVRYRDASHPTKNVKKYLLILHIINI